MCSHFQPKPYGIGRLLNTFEELVQVVAARSKAAYLTVSSPKPAENPELRLSLPNCQRANLPRRNGSFQPRHIIVLLSESSSSALEGKSVAAKATRQPGKMTQKAEISKIGWLGPILESRFQALAIAGRTLLLHVD
jgi:hypothetical protein